MYLLNHYPLAAQSEVISLSMLSAYPQDWQQKEKKWQERMEEVQDQVRQLQEENKELLGRIRCTHSQEGANEHSVF